MVYRAQFLFENSLDVSDILKGDGAVIEVPLSHLSVNNTIYKIADIFLGILGQATRGCLYRRSLPESIP